MTQHGNIMILGFTSRKNVKIIRGVAAGKLASFFPKLLVEVLRLVSQAGRGLLGFFSRQIVKVGHTLAKSSDIVLTEL